MREVPVAGDSRILAKTPDPSVSPGFAAAEKALGGQPVDFWLLGVALLLAGFGLMMVYSASGIMAEKFHQGDKLWFFKRQAGFLFVSLTVMTVIVLSPRKLFYDLTYPGLILAFGLLLLTLVGPFKAKGNGATRWVNLGPVSLQPLEFCKIAVVFYLAYFFSVKQALVKSFSVGFLPPFVLTGLMCALLLRQPDFGGAVTIILILFFMSFVGGTRLVYLILSGLAGLAAARLLVMTSSYRMTRLLSWDPFDDPMKSGYQLKQSLFAFGLGDWFGAGLGAGKQKLFYLPEAHNDFIMAVVGEELGFLGISAFVLLLVILLWRSFRVAYQQEELRDRFMAFGLTLVLALGFVLNLAVALGAVPPKGVAMPFMSYGGSNLLVSFICVGMLLNLSRRPG